MISVAEQKDMLETAIADAEERIAESKKIITSSKSKLRKLERIEKELNFIFSEEEEQEEYEQNEQWIN